jgi:hypothetical protein
MSPTVRMVYRIAADALFLSHVVIVLLICVGWYFPQLYLVHLLALFGASVSNVYFGNCIFSTWEFTLRKKVNPEVNYEHGYMTHYIQKIFGDSMRDSFMKQTIPMFYTLMPFAHLFDALIMRYTV